MLYIIYIYCLCSKRRNICAKMNMASLHNRDDATTTTHLIVYLYGALNSIIFSTYVIIITVIVT